MKPRIIGMQLACSTIRVARVSLLFLFVPLIPSNAQPLSPLALLIPRHLFYTPSPMCPRFNPTILDIHSRPLLPLAPRPKSISSALGQFPRRHSLSPYRVLRIQPRPSWTPYICAHEVTAQIVSKPQRLKSSDSNAQVCVCVFKNLGQFQITHEKIQILFTIMGKFHFFFFARFKLGEKK